MKKTKDFTPAEFHRSFSKINSERIFFIHGTESYLKEEILKTILKKYTNDSSSDFDHVSFFADEIKAVDVLENCEMLPFLSNFRTIVLKNFDKFSTTDQTAIGDYSKNPVDSTILIILCEKPDFRKSSFKNLKQNAVSILCKQAYSPRDMMYWLNGELTNRNIIMDNDAKTLFTQFVELDYLIASTELEKLYLYVKGRNKISSKDVMECVGRSKTHSIFELQNAVGRKDIKVALSYLENMMENNESVIFIVTMLTRFFSIIWKIHALKRQNMSDNEISSLHMKEIYHIFRKDYLAFSKKYSYQSLSKVFHYLLDTDIQLKSTQIKDHILAEMLIYNICRS